MDKETKKSYLKYYLGGYWTRKELEAMFPRSSVLKEKNKDKKISNLELVRYNYLKP